MQSSQSRLPAIIAGGSIMLFASVAPAAVWYVDAGATSGDGTTWGTAFQTIEEALAPGIAIAGDQVWVAAGTYAPSIRTSPGLPRTESFVLKDGVRMYGGFAGTELTLAERNLRDAANATILTGDLNGDDGTVGTTDNAFHVVTAKNVGATTVLDGFTIQAGRAQGSNPHHRGAGVFFENAHAVFANCNVVNCQANLDGAGIYFQSSAPFVVNCTFRINETAQRGGALYIVSDDPTIVNCVFDNNNADDGGAIYLADSDADISNSTFYGNNAGDDAGGIFSILGDPEINNCIFWSNSDFDGQFAQIDFPSGDPSVNFTCIQGGWDGLGGFGVIDVDPMFVDPDGTDNTEGTADDNLKLDFGSPCLDAGRNTALAKDKGDLDLDGITTETTPLDRDLRPRFLNDPDAMNVGIDSLEYPGTVVDMGAFERFPDCNDNDIIDSEEIAAGSSQDCTGNGMPDECEEDCQPNGQADICEIAAGSSQDCNTNGVPDECDPNPDCNQNSLQDVCEVAAGSSSDCNENEVPDECEIDSTSLAPGGPFFCTENCLEDCTTGQFPAGNGIPDVCEPDCQMNGIADLCDIEGGTSLDCTGNDIPDECEADCQPNGVADICEIAAGSTEDCTGNDIPDECEPDCNLNGVGDSCDILAGTSQDCTGNGIPDECEPDCNGSSTADTCDIQAGTSQDCTGNDIPDECEPDCDGNNTADVCDIASDATLDCDENGERDDCEIAADPSLDCQNVGQPGFGVLDTCDMDPTDPDGDGFFSDDCNSNGVPDACDAEFNDCQEVGEPGFGSPDECDIAAGISEDCNRDTVPDECQLDVFVTDCNSNGVLDICDIEDGTSSDCNFDDRPDECEPDCNANGIADECDINESTSEDCNFNLFPDECETQDTVVLTANFDGGLPEGWGVSGLWHATSVECASGTCTDFGTSWARFSKLNVCSFQTTQAEAGSLISPRFAIPASAGSATLTYCSAYQGEGGISPNGLDAASVRINGTILIDEVSGDATRPGANGDEWQLRTVSLDQFIGNEFSISFIFDSQDVVNNNMFGWQIDNVEVGYEGTDCNANAVPDDCDVFTGSSEDCNFDLVPDECQDKDCNNNEIRDVCELFAGTSEDCNDNGIPDKCDINAASTEPADDCDFAQFVCPGLIYSVEGVTASHDGGASCDATNTPDLWYRYRPVTDGNLAISVCDGDFDARVSAHSDCPTNPEAVELTCSADDCAAPRCGAASCLIPASVELAVSKDTLYWIRVSAAAPQELYTFALEVTGPACGEIDCLGNQIPDECDIEVGRTLDCDLNRIPDRCESDTDDDGLIDGCDNCPNVDNPTQEDVDGDQTGDLCDYCPFESELIEPSEIGKESSCADGIDNDCDGVTDTVDSDCVSTFGGCCFPLQGTCSNTTQSICASFGGLYQGNGSACSDDEDNDGVTDCFDLCPGTLPQTPIDADGCATIGACCVDAVNCLDGFTEANCQGLGATYQGNLTTCDPGDQDGDGATCDSCPTDNSKTSDGDTDGDRVLDCNDGCPDDSNKTEPGFCGCGLSDRDSDNDGIPDCVDVCEGFDDDQDLDGDNVTDGCDVCPLDNPDDTDGDGVCDHDDLCAGFDDTLDADGDNTPDDCDNCPNEPALADPSEPAAEVTCGDGIDNDCDGVTDGLDADCPAICACGDISGDGIVDLNDFVIFIQCFGPSPSCLAEELVCSDMNGVGGVDLNDVLIFISLFDEAPSTNAPPNCP